MSSVQNAVCWKLPCRSGTISFVPTPRLVRVNRAYGASAAVGWAEADSWTCSLGRAGASAVKQISRLELSRVAVSPRSYHAIGLSASDPLAVPGRSRGHPNMFEHGGSRPSSRCIKVEHRLQKSAKPGRSAPRELILVEQHRWQVPVPAKGRSLSAARGIVAESRRKYLRSRMFWSSPVLPKKRRESLPPKASLRGILPNSSIAWQCVRAGILGIWCGATG